MAGARRPMPSKLKTPAIPKVKKSEAAPLRLSAAAYGALRWLAENTGESEQAVIERLLLERAEELSQPPVRQERASRRYLERNETAAAPACKATRDNAAHSFGAACLNAGLVLTKDEPLDGEYRLSGRYLFRARFEVSTGMGSGFILDLEHPERSKIWEFGEAKSVPVVQKSGEMASLAALLAKHVDLSQITPSGGNHA